MTESKVEIKTVRHLDNHCLVWNWYEAETRELGFYFTQLLAEFPLLRNECIFMSGRCCPYVRVCEWERDTSFFGLSYIYAFHVTPITGYEKSSGGQLQMFNLGIASVLNENKLLFFLDEFYWDSIHFTFYISAGMEPMLFFKNILFSQI